MDVWSVPAVAEEPKGERWARLFASRTSTPPPTTMTTESFSSLFPHARYGARPVAILDGGMGTTLQAPPFNLPLDSTLWSSELLATSSGRAQLHDLHQLWVQSGAEIVGSCTYQSCAPLFLPRAPDDGAYTSADLENALDTMNSALPLVTYSFSPSTSFPSRTSTLSALSLGPFGAVLSPGQEYGGLYPPPYGTSNSPSTISFSHKAAEAFPSSEPVPTSTDAAEDALVEFHLSRLHHLSLSPAFSSLSLYAFETIPIIREARAIRRAITLLRHARPDQPRKPFYLSFVFPVDGNGQARCPDVDLRDLPTASDALSDAIVAAALGQREGEATPDGIGINCTNPLRILPLIDQLAGAINRAPASPISPWLVLYPDGGAVYDVVSRTWSNPDGLNDVDWGAKVADGVERALAQRRSDGAPTFAGVLAGGCCKAGPGAINALRKECEARSLLEGTR